MKSTLFFIAALVFQVILCTYVDPDAEVQSSNTFSLQNLLYGAIGSFAVILIIVSLLWKCVLSPVIDLTWDTAISVMWIIVISALLCFFTLMLWFIT
jgi:hypothetical protein